MRVEIFGNVNMEPDTYAELRSDLGNVLGEDRLKLEGSGYGKLGIDYGFTGPGPLSTKTVREVEKAIHEHGFKVGVEEGQFVIMVFAK